MGRNDQVLKIILKNQSHQMEVKPRPHRREGKGNSSRRKEKEIRIRTLRLDSNGAKDTQIQVCMLML